MTKKELAKTDDLVTCLICGEQKPRATSLQYDLDAYQCRECWKKEIDDAGMIYDYWQGQVYG